MDLPPRFEVFDCRLVLVGSCGVGKSSLLERFVAGSFTPTKPTLGVDIRTKKFRICDKGINLVVFDTPGKDSADCIVSSVYRGAHAVFICFDLTDSFSDVSNWLNDVMQQGPKDAVRYLVGCKGDSTQQVPEIAAKNLAAKYGCEYFEVSAKSGRGVDTLFSSALFKTYSFFFDRSKQLQVTGANSLFNKNIINGLYVASYPDNSERGGNIRAIYRKPESHSTELLYADGQWIIKKHNRLLASVPCMSFMFPYDAALQGQWSENAGAYFSRPFSQPLIACTLAGSTPYTVEELPPASAIKGELATA